MFANVKSLIDDVLDRVTWRTVIGALVALEVLTDEQHGQVIGLIENVVSVLAQGG